MINLSYELIIIFKLLHICNAQALRMHNLDLTFEELLEDIFSDNLDDNENQVKLFCENIILND
jgi:hypothetical protein